MEKLADTLQNQAYETISTIRDAATEALQQFETASKEQMAQVIEDVNRRLEMLHDEKRVYKQELVKINKEATEKIKIIQKELEMHLTEVLTQTRNQVQEAIIQILDQLGAGNNKQLKKELKDITGMMEKLSKEINKTMNNFGKEMVKQINEMCTKIPDS